MSNADHTAHPSEEPEYSRLLRSNLEHVLASVIADGRGMAVAFALAPGQAHESRQAPELLAAMPHPAFWSVADRDYASHAVRQRRWDRGSRPAIPAKTSDRQPVACPD